MISAFLVTGATKGLGRAVTRHLAKLKYPVYAVGRTASLLNELAKENPLIHPVCADITNKNDLEKIVSTVSSETSFSIIHNAAIANPRLFMNDSNNELLKKHFEVNLFAPLELTRKLLPFLRNGQRILYISSGAADLTLSGLMPYCISKSALEHAIRCLNVEFSENNIYFSILRPGMINTPMQKKLRDSESTDLPGKDFYVKSFTEKNLRDPEDIAKFVSWVILKSNDGEYANTVWDVTNAHNNMRL